MVSFHMCHIWRALRDRKRRGPGGTRETVRRGMERKGSGTFGSDVRRKGLRNSVGSTRRGVRGHGTERRGSGLYGRNRRVEIASGHGRGMMIVVVVGSR